MNILFVSPEVVPFAKTGGLADVAGALPKALEHQGSNVRVVMPRYKIIGIKKYNLKKIMSAVAVKILDQFEYADIYEGKLPGSSVKIYFVSNKKYFDRLELYQEAGLDYPDNCERFSFFCKVVMEFVERLNWKPDIVHCNDWQTALIIPYSKFVYKWKAKTIYSIHNLAYLGTFPKEDLHFTGFGWEMFTPERLEFWDKIALSKAGFVFADKINTVSPTYAREIQTREYGCGMEGLLQSRSKDLSGILNGLDYSVWNPEKDRHIAKKFSIQKIALKSANKIELQKENRISKSKTLPLIGMISRLVEQKGFDLLAVALPEVMKLKCQVVILGTGHPKYHELLEEMRKKYPKLLGINLGFNAALAQRIYAGSDMFLMPSRYEPCGLGQLISFKYGTIPIVRLTGGLADTVSQFNPQTGEGDGFVFQETSPEALFKSIKQAVQAYRHHKKAWKKLQQKVMDYDYSWDASAKKYIDLYNKAIGESEESDISKPLCNQARV